MWEWEKWTWMPFVVYMKVRNRDEYHWTWINESMVTGLSKPLYHDEPFEIESDNEKAKVSICSCPCKKNSPEQKYLQKHKKISKY
jgi:hypothetical protein